MTEPERHPEAIPVTDAEAEKPAPKPRRSRKKQQASEPVADSANPLVEAAKEQLGAVEVPDDGDQERRVSLPDPHWSDSISLTNAKDGPRIHLGRSRRYRQMLIAFDVKPEGEVGGQVLATLRDQGWRYHAKDKAWTVQLERGAEWRTAADAEKLFRDVGNTLREANGLPPVGQQMTI
jgi:hypothetical protein